MPAVPAPVPPTSHQPYTRSPDLYSTARGAAAHQMLGESKRPLSVEAGWPLVELTVGAFDASRRRVVAFMAVVRQSPDDGGPQSLDDLEVQNFRTAFVLESVALNQSRSLYWLRYARRVSTLLAPHSPAPALAADPLSSFFERTDRLARENGLPTAASTTACDVWSSARSAAGVPLRRPSAGHAADGSVTLSWNTDADYLELEFSPGGTWDAFYRDKSASGPDAVLSLEDQGPGGTVPSEVVEKLRRLARSSE